MPRHWRETISAKAKPGVAPCMASTRVEYGRKAMHVTTLPVYSRLAADQDVSEEIQARIPTGWGLSTHQVETYRALRSDVDIVFNTAMTGDGKSLAGQLPMLLHHRPIM